MLSCCCNHFGVKAIGLMERGGMGIPPPGSPRPLGSPSPPLPMGPPFPSLSSSPLPLVPLLNLLLKQLTNLYPLVFVCLFVLFVCVLHAQEYFKLFEVAKERQLNCELFFL